MVMRCVRLVWKTAHITCRESFPVAKQQRIVHCSRFRLTVRKLFLLMSPTGNLDEANEQIVLDLFKNLHEQGTTIIVVTHDSTVAGQAGDDYAQPR